MKNSVGEKKNVPEKRPHPRGSRPAWWFPTKTVLSIDIGTTHFAWWCGLLQPRRNSNTKMLCQWETHECDVVSIFPEGKSSKDFSNRECTRFLFEFMTSKFSKEWFEQYNVEAVFIESQFKSPKFNRGNNNRAEVIANGVETCIWFITDDTVKTTTVSSQNKTTLVKREAPSMFPSATDYKAMNPAKRKNTRKKVVVEFARKIAPDIFKFVNDRADKFDDVADTWTQAVSSTKKLRDLFPHLNSENEADKFS